MNFPIRYIAQIIVEAETPLSIGSDSLLFDQDAPVEKDCNGLPYIPGTAIAGFLRHKLKGLSKLFGDEADSHSDQPQGSNIVISEAFLLDNKYKAHQKPENITNDFLLQYYNLPIRQHVAINAFGTSKDSSLFDQEIVFKGSRFKFEIELQLKTKNDSDWQTILNAFYDNDLYIGSGQFNSFGELKVIEIKEITFDLSKDLKAYLKLTVDLNQLFKGATYEDKTKVKCFNEEMLKLSGKNSFFHFGAGFGDKAINAINYTENIIEGWENNTPDFKLKYVIPSTSIKGVIAHRVAYHYNKKNNNYIEKLWESQLKTQYAKLFDSDTFKMGDTIEDLEKQLSQLKNVKSEIKQSQLKLERLFTNYSGSNNEAVKSLFGKAKNDTDDEGTTGKVIFKDVYLDFDTTPEIVFAHNKIDRYTGGVIQSALYNEKVLCIDKIKLEIKTKNLKEAGSYLVLALTDLKKSMLPLGGLVNKGHGVFVELKP